MASPGSQLARVNGAEGDGGETGGRHRDGGDGRNAHGVREHTCAERVCRPPLGHLPAWLADLVRPHEP
jgi:hypothetical protein